jgi:hypothetical protein
MTETNLSPYDAVGLAEGFIPADDDEQVREAWQYLVDTGLAWSLQGWFGRMAAALIEAGEIDPPEPRKPHKISGTSVDVILVGRV